MDLEILKQKLNNSQVKYLDKEVNWLLENIGNSKSEIRDNLVCNSLGAGFFEGKFTKNQILFLINQLEERNLLFYRIQENGEATLTRSFTCLLWDLIIRTNNDKNSRYYQVLNKNEEQQIFEDLIKYLANEHDFTGFSKKIWLGSCNCALLRCIGRQHTL